MRNGRQIALSKIFGSLKSTVRVNQARGTHFSGPLNVDLATNKGIADED